jgi:hypothetical protein
MFLCLGSDCVTRLPCLLCSAEHDVCLYICSYREVVLKGLSDPQEERRRWSPDRANRNDE